MKGTVASRTTGVEGPWPGGGSRSFERSEVVAFGKIRRYGDFLTRYMVRLADGAEIFVKACDQPREDERWLRQLARGAEGPEYPNRDVPVVLTWKEIVR